MELVIIFVILRATETWTCSWWWVIVPWILDDISERNK